MCSHPSGETWARNFGRDVEAGVLPGEDGLTELQRVPVDDDRGQQVEAGEPVVLSFGSVSHAAHFPQGGASSFWRGYAASLRRIWLGRMVPAAMVAATRRMSAQFLSIRSTFTLPPTRRRKVLRDARAFELLPSARNRQKLDSGRPQDVVVAGGIVKPTACACVTDVKARRFAPPPLRGADGLDAGSAHARPDWLLPTMLTHTPPTCCGRRPVQNDALSGDR